MNTDLDHGAWIAYHPDWSGLVIFPTELQALRHAVEHSMSVKFVAYGEDAR